jgi:hypothetical protein
MPRLCINFLDINVRNIDIICIQKHYLRIYRSLHKNMAEPFSECIVNQDALHKIMQNEPVTRETGSDCGNSRG